MIYTPGVNIGAASLREGVRLSVGEVIGTRTAKPKNQSLANYRLTFRRKDNEYSVFADNSDGILKILGRWIDVRIPREALTNVPSKPLKIWVMPKAPATTIEYTVKEMAPKRSRAAADRVRDR